MPIAPFPMRDQSQTFGGVSGFFIQCRRGFGVGECGFFFRSTQNTCEDKLNEPTADVCASSSRDLPPTQSNTHRSDLHSCVCICVWGTVLRTPFYCLFTDPVNIWGRALWPSVTVAERWTCRPCVLRPWLPLTNDKWAAQPLQLACGLCCNYTLFALGHWKTNLAQNESQKMYLGPDLHDQEQ